MCKEDSSKKSGGSRNSEKRRERSKVAARCRRGKESEIFSELASYLPLPEHLRKTLDKASIARLAVTHLRLKGIMSDVFGGRPQEDRSDGEEFDVFDELQNQAMGGFVFVMSSDGDVAYASESLTKCLGLSQCEVMGQSIFDFSHPCDHEDIKDLLALNKSTPKEQPISRTAFFRMKCTITSKGRSVHLRAATYKGISCNGKLYWDEKDPKVRWYIGVGEPLSEPADVNFPLDKQAFVTRHSMDMKCEDVGGSVQDFMGYTPEDLVGKSFYEFHHAADGGILAKNIKALYTKGQIQTERYRFLAKNGGWVWCITQATVLKSENGAKANGIICLHFIISGVENRHEILSDLQCKGKEISMEPVSIEAEAIRLPEIIAGLNKPIPCTTKIFAPRTEDMNSGFLIHSEDSLIVSKEEPEDLTHLAPIAGDECVPLCLPNLDDLLRSLDQANVAYSMEGYTLKVDAERLPLLTLTEPQSRNALPALLSEASMLLKESETSPSSCPDSPFSLNSDPHMGTVVNRNFFKFPSPTSFHGPVDGDETFFLEEALKELDSYQELVSLEDEIGIQKEKPFQLPDELSEFRAPYIPTAGEDIELLYKSPGYNSPTEATISGGNEIPSTGNFGTIITDSTPQPSQQMNESPSVVNAPSKFSDRNVDQITWTLDVGSIFAARKPEDQPVVMTQSVFSHLDSPPPPTKVMKTATVMASPRPEVVAEFDSSPDVGGKYPFHKTFRNLKELGEGGGPGTMKTELTDCSVNLSGIRPPDTGGGLRDVARNFLGKRDFNRSFMNGIEGRGRLPTFYELTRQDYEIMVPLLEASLLQGSELLNALDSVGDPANGYIANV